MKRVKVLLTSLAILTIVGGTLAFKSKKLTGVCYYTSTASGTCSKQGVGFTTIADESSSIFAITLDDNGNCPSTAQCTVKARLVSEP